MAGYKYDPKTQKQVGCRAKVRAYRSRRKGVKCWTITEVSLNHTNCHGEQGNASLASVEELIAVLVRANPKITGPGLAKTLRATAGISVHPRTALRAKATALGRTVGACKAGYTALTSLLHHLESTEGTYTNTLVRADTHLSSVS